MSGKTARRLRKERAMGAAAAAAIAVAITPGIAQATEVTTTESATEATQATTVQTQATTPEVKTAASQAPAVTSTSEASATETKSEPAATPTTSNESAATTATSSDQASTSESGNKQAEATAQAAEPAKESTSASSSSTAATSESTTAKAHAPLAQSAAAKAPAASAVARVGETDYDDIDSAINAAADGGTVTLLKDATGTKAFHKSLTITGGHTLTYDLYGWYYKKTLTVDGARLVINSDANRTKADEDQGWLVMCLDGTINVKNGGSVEFVFDGNTGANCAIYTNKGVTINVDNHSNFSVKGLNAKKTGQGIQLDRTAGTGIFVRNGSTFTIDGTNRGYVNSPTVYVEDSTFTVKNCSSNASNGGTFTAIRSTVTFDNNAGHGLSANDTTFDNSKFYSTGNGYSGLDVMGKFNVKNHSLVEVSGNGWHSWSPDLFASIRLRNDATIDGTSVVNVHDNYDVGIHTKNPKGRSSVITFKPGSKLYVVNNGLMTYGAHGEKAGQEFTTNGGGIWNTAILTLPSGAVIYNNNATKSGDDIYSTGTITIGSAVRKGDKYYLDGQQNNVCKDLIDGWYDDSTIKPADPDSTDKQAEPKGGRWVGDIPENGTTKDIYTKAIKAGTYVSSADDPLAIKAAHIYKDSLVYDKNAKDATGTMDPSAGVINDEGRWVKRVGVRKNAFKRAGYKFIGWNTKADGTGAWYGIVDAALAAARDSLDEYDLLDGQDNDVLYAIWEKLPEPEKPTPKTPTPAKTVTPAPKPAPKHMKPAVAKTVIPKTGDNTTGGLFASILGLIGLGSVGASGMLRKRDHNE